MKEDYIEAEMEVIEFECEDIITNSNTNSTPFAPYSLLDELGNPME